MFLAAYAHRSICVVSDQRIKPRCAQRRVKLTQTIATRVGGSGCGWGFPSATVNAEGGIGGCGFPSGTNFEGGLCGGCGLPSARYWVPNVKDRACSRAIDLCSIRSCSASTTTHDNVNTAIANRSLIVFSILVNVRASGTPATSASRCSKSEQRAFLCWVATEASSGGGVLQ
jgi:hypothetical protein